MATPLNPSYYLHLAAKRGYLRKGAGNRAAVKALQIRLSELGHAVSTDGIFGEETEKALRKLQERTGAKVDGIVGEETLGKLQRAKRKEGSAASTDIAEIEKVVGNGQPRTARSGRGLGDIRAEQRGGGRGAGAARDGVTKTRGKKGDGKDTEGPHGGTKDASGYERASDKTGPIGSTKPLSATEVAEGGDPMDPKNTPTSQDNNPEFNEKHPRGPGGKFAAKGSQGTEVRNTQQALNEVDDAKLKDDGDFGDKTDKAVRGYQRKAGLRVDGIVGPKTAASLRRRLRSVERANQRDRSS